MVERFAVDKSHPSRPDFALVEEEALVEEQVYWLLVAEQVSWLLVKEGPWAVPEGRSPS